MSYYTTDRIVESPANRRDFNKLIEDNRDKYIVAKFGADWCGPCRRINPMLHNFFTNSSTGAGKMLILVDADRHRDVHTAYRIATLPTIITFVDGERDKVIETSDREMVQSALYP